MLHKKSITTIIINLWTLVWSVPAQVDPFCCEAYLRGSYTFHYYLVFWTLLLQYLPGTGARPWSLSSCVGEIFYQLWRHLQSSYYHWWFCADSCDCLQRNTFSQDQLFLIWWCLQREKCENMKKCVGPERLSEDDLVSLESWRNLSVLDPKA